jgi:hypothetical protein
VKSAPLVAGSALALLLLAIATANPFAPLRKIVPLDFTGIDTLELHGSMPQIRISSHQPMLADYPDEMERTLAVLRKGNRLVITVHSEGYEQVQLNVPASLRAIDAERAHIVALERLQSMQVSSSGPINWEGDIDQLDLRDTADHSKRIDERCRCEDSGTTFTVSGGHISELQVRSSRGDLQLMQPDRIDAVYAWLGEKGGISLTNAHRVDNIHLLAAEAQIPDATSPKPYTTP